MSGDKRTVATDALATLGTIIDDKQKRDAIHLAVEPVIAGTTLRPGQRVKVVNGVAWPEELEGDLGIVDPFIEGFVGSGQRFWFIMYPRMVHSLRHVWTHPAFPDEIGTPAPAPEPSKAVSEAWLRDYADRVNPYLAIGGYSNKHDDKDMAYKTLMSDIRRGELTYHGIDMHSQGDLIDADNLQYHASVVLGRQVKWDEFEYFSCTC
jgi:hypothetical protein